MQDTQAGRGAPTPPQTYTTYSPAPPAVSAAKRSGGTRVGALLVVLGVLLLAMHVVPGASIARLWPLIIVAAGFVQILTPDRFEGWGPVRVTEGLGVMLVGFVLLGCTLGYVAWSMWWTLLGLWPVALIAVGLKILGRAMHAPWLAAVAPLLLWAAFLYAAGTAWTGSLGLAPLPLFGFHAPITFTAHGL